jgi:3-hydroxybutyryl-CoA dehydratase
VKTAADFRVGDSFELVREADRYRPVYYGAVSGDFNPIHIDPDVGRAAGFPGAILQGMCTMAWMADACTAYLGDPARVKRLRVRFSRPVVVGDVVTLRGRCVAVEGPVIRLAIEARNQRGEEVLKGASAEGWVEEG